MVQSVTKHQEALVSSNIGSVQYGRICPSERAEVGCEESSEERLHGYLLASVAWQLAYTLAIRSEGVG